MLKNEYFKLKEACWAFLVKIRQLFFSPSSSSLYLTLKNNLGICSTFGLGRS